MFDQNISNILKYCGKVKIIKAPPGFKLMTYSSNPCCYAVRLQYRKRKKFINYA